jgi:hypothetical protein
VRLQFGVAPASVRLSFAQCSPFALRIGAFSSLLKTNTSSPYSGALLRLVYQQRTAMEKWLMFNSSYFHQSRVAPLLLTATFTLGLSAACGESGLPEGSETGGNSSGASTGSGGRAPSGGTSSSSGGAGSQADGGTGNLGGALTGGRSGAGGSPQVGGDSSLGGANDGSGGRVGSGAGGRGGLGSGGMANSEDCPEAMPEADSECTPPETSGGGPGGGGLACTYDTERCTCRTQGETSTWRCFTPGAGGPGAGAGGRTGGPEAGVGGSE